ncbi:MAG: hypothetical protein R2815_00115 [Flavobacteriales bacterium]|nr:hypothetical protein [Flavobacteriales bacterium]
MAKHLSIPMRAFLLTGCTLCALQAAAQQKDGIAAADRERFSLIRSIAEANERMFSDPAPFPPWNDRALPKAWSYDRLGLFCKLDVQLERRLPIPVFFRIGGDVRQVELWEGKRSDHP